MAISWSSYRVMVGSQVRDSEVRWSRRKASLFHSSRVGALTLSNEITPLKASGRVTVCAGWLGSSKVKACVLSVGLHARNLGVSPMFTSLT